MGILYSYEPSWYIDEHTELERRMLMEKDLTRYNENWQPTVFHSKHHKARVLRAKARVLRAKARRR